MSSRPPGSRRVVQATADALRQRIFAAATGAQIGSLSDLARDFDVGVVTVQQAARILEHEGLLEVRRGPRGGYYGRRPRRADLERVLAAYLQSEPASWQEVLDITSLLFNRVCAAAAAMGDEDRRLDELARMRDRIAACAEPGEVGLLETVFQELLFSIVRRPLFELLTYVALQVAQSLPSGEDVGVFELDQWKDGRCRIIDAIVARDPELAHFEADRRNRRFVLAASQLGNR